MQQLRFAQDVRLPRIVNVGRAVEFAYLLMNRIHDKGAIVEQRPELKVVAFYNDIDGLTIYTEDEFLELINSDYWIPYLGTDVDVSIFGGEVAEFFDMPEDEDPQTDAEMRAFMIREFTGA